MYLLVLAGFGLVLSGQESRRTSSATYDLHGRPVSGPTVVESSSASAYHRTEMVESLNGRKVPLQSIDERVVSEGGGIKVVERIVRRYDANGRPGPRERTIVEERRGSDGSSSILESRYRADLNGREHLWERARTEISLAGTSRRSETILERQGPNASLEFVEKNTAVTRSTGSGSEDDVVTFRRNESGRLYEAAREVTARTSSDGMTVEKIASYEAQVPGRLQLTGQVVKRIVGHSGGTRTEIDVYSSDIAGRPQAEPRLREQQVIERKPASGDGFTESISVRRPSVNEPNRFGRFEKVSEVVCTGKCAEKQTPAAASRAPGT